jgi:hypothetical protein
MRIRIWLGGLAAAVLAIQAAGAEGRGGPQVWILKRDGQVIEGRAAFKSLVVNVDGKSEKVNLDRLLSVSMAAPATPEEARRIAADLALVSGKDFKACEAASERLSDLGLPALTPVLKSYEDRDGHLPDPLYRLFARIIPGYADRMDRSLDLVRLQGGDAVRGKLGPATLTLEGASGPISLPTADIRRLAVKQTAIDVVFDLQAMRDCTYVSWLDTGIKVGPASQVRSDAGGLVRLSYDEDGWACDPDGIADPLPGKRRLQEGFRWGAILGRVGTSGDRWLVGKHIDKTAPAAGRLYYVINDNEHWQNNIGSYRVRLHVTDAYDLNDPA